MSIRPDRPHPPNIPTRPPPSAPRLPPLARATDAPRQREAVRKYVEGLLGVRVPPDLLQRLGPSRVDAAAAVDAVAGISGVEELPVAPPEGQGRAVGGTAPDADLTKGPVVRTRLRDMQRHRMKARERAWLESVDRSGDGCMLAGRRHVHDRPRPCASASSQAASTALRCYLTAARTAGEPQPAYHGNTSLATEGGPGVRDARFDASSV